MKKTKIFMVISINFPVLKELTTVQPLKLTSTKYYIFIFVDTKISLCSTETE